MNSFEKKFRIKTIGHHTRIIIFLQAVKYFCVARFILTFEKEKNVITITVCEWQDWRCWVLEKFIKSPRPMSKAIISTIFFLSAVWSRDVFIRKPIIRRARDVPHPVESRYSTILWNHEIKLKSTGLNGCALCNTNYLPAANY